MSQKSRPHCTGTCTRNLCADSGRTALRWKRESDANPPKSIWPELRDLPYWAFTLHSAIASSCVLAQLALPAHWENQNCRTVKAVGFQENCVQHSKLYNGIECLCCHQDTEIYGPYREERPRIHSSMIATTAAQTRSHPGCLQRHPRFGKTRDLDSQVRGQRESR